MKYRRLVDDSSLCKFRVKIKESDILIRAEKDLRKEAKKILLSIRREIEGYIAEDSIFLTTFVPYKPNDDAPAIIKEMAEAGRMAAVGPMAAVAGAIAEKLGQELRLFSEEIIVENGGDIFINSKVTRKVAIYSKSPFFNNISILIEPDEMPIGVCTSSGTMGRSISFGKADVSLILAKSTALADAWATAIGNLIQKKSDIDNVIEEIKNIPEIRGAIIIKDDCLGACGKGFTITL